MIVLSEDDALVALFAVAAMRGGYVNRVIDFGSMREHDGRAAGYCVLPKDDAWPVDKVELFCWRRADGVYGRMTMRSFTGIALPGGRVDRGLGAIKNRPGKP